MDILIKVLQKDILESRVSEFIDILTEEPHEYWKEEHFKMDLPGKYDLSVVAFSGKSIAGYIIASLKKKVAYVHKFMVRKEFRNISVGGEMLVFFEKNLSEKGYSLVELTVREDNPLAITFYERKLFVISGKRTDSTDNSTLFIMTKNILT